MATALDGIRKQVEEDLVAWAATGLDGKQPADDDVIVEAVRCTRGTDYSEHCGIVLQRCGGGRRVLRRSAEY